MGGLNVYWLLLIQALIRISWGCAGLSNSIADIYPETDLNVLVGGNYSLTCALSEFGKVNYTVTDLYFTIGERPLEDVLPNGTWEITKANSSAVVLTVQNATVASNVKYVYFCRARGNEERLPKSVCMRYVYVGYPPGNVSDFRCISENLDSLTCTWRAPSNPIKTTYDLYYRTGSFSRQKYHPNEESFCGMCSSGDDLERHCWRNCPNYLSVSDVRVACMIINEAVNEMPQSLQQPTLRQIQDGFRRLDKMKWGAYDCTDKDFASLQCTTQNVFLGVNCSAEGVEENQVENMLRRVKETIVPDVSLMALDGISTSKEDKVEVMLRERNSGLEERYILPFNWTDIVRPAPAEGLQVVNLNPKKAQLSFDIHYNMFSLPEGLAFDIRYRIVEPWLTEPSIYLIDSADIDRKARAVNKTIDLPHPHLHYSFEIRMRSYTANSLADHLWSDVSVYSLQAYPAVPERPPKITTGSFEIKEQSFGQRGVYIYWQKLEEELKNGDGFHYEVAVYDLLGRMKIMEKSPVIRDAYAYFDLIGKESYTFVVTAVNDMGRSENSSEILVSANSELESVPYPRALTKISYDNGTYELAWNRAEGVDSYTLFWCRYNRDRPYQCDGFLNWMSVPADQTLVTMDVDNQEAIYQFAIASVSGGISSGMRWASCTLLSNNVLGQITEFEVTGASCSSLNVKWKLECADSVGFIEEFRIYYCPYDREKRSCSGPNKTMSTSAFSSSAEITDLRSYSWYVVQISAVTRAGEGAISDPRYNQTTEGVPSAPVGLSVGEVKNSSFVVTWQEPSHANGIITGYEVSYQSQQSSVRTQSLDSKRLNITGLSPHTNYTVTVRACTKVGCSEEATPISVLTRIGVPGVMPMPYVKYATIDGSQSAEIEWGLPKPASGPRPHYRVKAVAFRGDRNESYPTEVYDVGPNNYTDVKLLKCSEDPSLYSYNISVQAYNPLDLNQSLYGEWSKEVLHPCMKAGIGTTVLIVVCSIVAFGIAVVGLILGGVWIKNKYEESQSIAKSVQFPWGPSVPTLGKPPKEFQNGASRGVKENNSQSSMKPLFQRINSDLSFTHIVESQTSCETETGEVRRSSQSSGCSSAQDSEKSSQTRTRSRQSTDSGAFVNGSSGSSSKEKLSKKHSELDRSVSLVGQQSPPSYIQVPPGPPSLPEGYSRLGLIDTDITSSRLENADYVPYPPQTQSSPTPSSRSTSSESSLLKDQYRSKPEIVRAKSDLSFGDFELLETGFTVGEKSKMSLNDVAVPSEKQLNLGYVQVGLDTSTGYVPIPVSEKLPRSDYVQVSDFEPKSLSPGYTQVGFEVPNLSSPKGVESQIKSPGEGYVHVGLLPEKTFGYVPAMPDNVCQATNGYVTLNAVNGV